MEEKFEQLTMEEITKEHEKVALEIISEICKTPTSMSDIEQGKFVATPLPSEVKKGRSDLIDNVISARGNENNKISIVGNELSDITKTMVTTRVSLSYAQTEEGTVSFSRALTNFDREVIDAVATLAPQTQVMTAAMIYRVITGKSDNASVSNPQRKRVEDSMDRCASCQVEIDITSEMEAYPHLNPDRNVKLKYKGNVIKFDALVYETHRGKSTYFKINAMPSLYSLAEKLGKVSVVPLKLLDSPVSKTDSIISIQSYLIREIDSMKRDDTIPRVIEWDTIYKMSVQEGKQESKIERKRIRDGVHKILGYWTEEKFILNYEAKPRGKFIEITLHSTT